MPLRLGGFSPSAALKPPQRRHAAMIPSRQRSSAPEDLQATTPLVNCAQHHPANPNTISRREAARPTLRRSGDVPASTRPANDRAASHSRDHQHHQDQVQPPVAQPLLAPNICKVLRNRRASRACSAISMASPGTGNGRRAGQRRFRMWRALSPYDHGNGWLPPILPPDC